MSHFTRISLFVLSWDYYRRIDANGDWIRWQSMGKIVIFRGMVKKLFEWASGDTEEKLIPCKCTIKIEKGPRLVKNGFEDLKTDFYE